MRHTLLAGESDLRQVDTGHLLMNLPATTLAPIPQYTFRPCRQSRPSLPCPISAQANRVATLEVAGTREQSTPKEKTLYLTLTNR